MSTAFLTKEDLIVLTGKCWKSKQIAALRKMGLPFFVNSCGKPIVSVAVVEGKKEPPRKKTWEMPD